MAGWKHQDIQWTIIPMIMKATPNTTLLFIYYIRSIIEYIYKAQNSVHSDASIASMVEALKKFHVTQHSIVEAEAWQDASGVKLDFNIPKLELLQSLVCNVKDNGTLLHYSVNILECLLITHCKNPFKHISQQASTFIQQVAAILNHEESMCHFNLYHILHLSQAPIENAIIAEDHEVTTINPALSFIFHVAPEESHMFNGPHAFCNHFQIQIDLCYPMTL